MKADTVVWTASDAVIADSNLAKFLGKAGISDLSPAGFNLLGKLAEQDPEWFWNLVIKETGVQFYEPYKKVFDVSQGIQWAKWCVGGTTNVVLNCLDKNHDIHHLDKEAIVWNAENGISQSWSYEKLNVETSMLADGLRALGIQPGDVVGLYMPMVPYAAAAMLAVNKVGAIILPLFSGFGAEAVASRLSDAGAVGVMTADGTWRRGKHIDLKSTIDSVVSMLPAIKYVVVLKNTAEDVSWNIATDHWWHELCEGRPTDVPTEIMPADAPAMIMYTSGTTGKPKGTVHSHSGLVTKLAMDMSIFADYKASDRMMWVSDMGWLVGPLLVYASTFVGATIVMAEGAYDYPDQGRFWRLIQNNRVSFLGIAPTIIRSFMQEGGAGVENYDLSSLRIAFSSGEPWTDDAWMWMFENVCQKRIPIINYSGGTEVCGGILIGTLLHPLKPCSFSGPIPGMGADIVDDDGHSVTAPGVGELVLRRPSIGMTRGLWNDSARYLNSYWGKWPALWVHGDTARIDSDGFWFISGRSDDTLKITGKRTGPSEIETLVMATGLANEVAAIGLPDLVKGETVGLFVTLMPGVSPDSKTRKCLIDAVISGLGAAFRPSSVMFVNDIPKTRNMKIMRRVVRAVYLGLEPGDLSSLINPESLDCISEAIGTQRNER